MPRIGMRIALTRTSHRLGIGHTRVADEWPLCPLFPPDFSINRTPLIGILSLAQVHLLQ
jgi:hypothetical protein